VSECSIYRSAPRLKAHPYRKLMHDLLSGDLRDAQVSGESRSSLRCDLSGLPDKTFQWDMQLVMKTTNHRQRQGPLAVDDFRHSTTRANQWLQILARQIHLFHSKLDGIDRIWRVNRMVFRLVVLDQHQRNVQFITLRCVPLRAPQPVNAFKRQSCSLINSCENISANDKLGFSLQGL